MTRIIEGKRNEMLDAVELMWLFFFFLNKKKCILWMSRKNKAIGFTIRIS